MEQLVVLAIIGLLSLINWALQKSNEKRKQAKAKRGAAQVVRKESRRNIYTQPLPKPSPKLERDPLHDLMEALGLPPEATPPIMTQREVLPPPVPVEEEEFASLEDAPRRPVFRALPPVEKPLPRAAVVKADAPFVRPPPAVTPIQTLLSNRASVRQAVILTEILGSPRGLAMTYREEF